MNDLFVSILRGASEAGASDIHIKAGSPFVFRVGRVLRPVEAQPPDVAWVRAVIDAVMPAHVREIFERDKEADFAFALPEIGRFRANAYIFRDQPALALRLVKANIRTFSELNLPDAVRKVAEAPRGIVIVAGAIGSGKSTTLAAMVEHINQTARKHIITLEDPIEFLFTERQSVIEQREVGLDTASFATGLRHVLRQDPDVIVVGEMRDAASIHAAMSAANIGHLVLTTMHTTDATKSVQRIVELFPTDERDTARRLFASTLHAIVCQRLVKAAAGGIIPATEVLVNTAQTAKAIEDDQAGKLRGVMELCAADGMQTFDQSLARLVQEKRITKEEALANASNADSMRLAFQGVVLTESRRILGER